MKFLIFFCLWTFGFNSMGSDPSCKNTMNSIEEMKSKNEVENKEKSNPNEQEPKSKVTVTINDEVEYNGKKDHLNGSAQKKYEESKEKNKRERDKEEKLKNEASLNQKKEGLKRVIDSVSLYESDLVAIRVSKNFLNREIGFYFEDLKSAEDFYLQVTGKENKSFEEISKIKFQKRFKLLKIKGRHERKAMDEIASEEVFEDNNFNYYYRFNKKDDSYKNNFEKISEDLFVVNLYGSFPSYLHHFLANFVSSNTKINSFYIALNFHDPKKDKNISASNFLKRIDRDYQNIPFDKAKYGDIGVVYDKESIPLHAFVKIDDNWIFTKSKLDTAQVRFQNIKTLKSLYSERKNILYYRKK